MRRNKTDMAAFQLFFNVDFYKQGCYDKQNRIRAVGAGSMEPGKGKQV